jgi:membrane protease YdiL (CAAX protease family)
MDNPKTKIGLFLALTFLLSAISWIPMLRSGDIGMGGGLYILATMWCPGVAAVITRLVTQKNLRGMGWVPRTLGLLALAYVLPILYAMPVYSAVWGLELGGFDPSRWQLEPGMSPLQGLLLIGSIGALMGLVSATGEEIGWRGLLVPELAKVTSARNSALISGLIWAAWHMPLIIGANYRSDDTPLLYSLACFTVMITGLSFIMAWITLKSRSLWPAALLHSTHNLFIQGLFDGATVNGPATGWWTGEFGIGLALAIALAAALLWRLETPGSDAPQA